MPGFPPRFLLESPGLSRWKPLDDPIDDSVCLHGGLGTRGVLCKERKATRQLHPGERDEEGEIQGGLKPEGAVQTSCVARLQRHECFNWTWGHSWDGSFTGGNEEITRLLERTTVVTVSSTTSFWDCLGTWQIRLARWHLSFQGFGRSRRA